MFEIKYINLSKHLWKPSKSSFPWGRLGWDKKKGKLPTSHRYDRLPLLRSRPGGFNRSWLCRTCQWQRYNL